MTSIVLSTFTIFNADPMGLLWMTGDLNKSSIMTHHVTGVDGRLMGLTCGIFQNRDQSLKMLKIISSADFSIQTA